MESCKPALLRARSMNATGRGTAGVLLAIAILQALVSTGSAQVRPVVLTDATVLVGDGSQRENCSIVLQGGKIATVSADVDPPLLSRKVSVKGKFVTPGLIDVWSRLAQPAGGDARPAESVAESSFDVYDRDQINAALSQGVTAICLTAPVANGIGGQATVIRLLAGDSAEAMRLKDVRVLCAGVGGDGNLNALARVRSAADLRQTWIAAREYRESWNTYEDQLKEYEEKLAKRSEAKKEDEKKADKSDRGKTAADEAPPQPPRRRRPRPPGGERPAEGEKKDELKRPSPPEKDRGKELLLRVLDGELRWRVECHRPEDILNVLQIAREFNIALVIEGATGAHRVAEQLAEGHVPVVLGAARLPLAYAGGAAQYGDESALDQLRDAGVRVYLGTGPGEGGWSATRNLLLRVALAVGRGLPADKALPIVTGEAAAFLGVEDRIGRVREGLDADLVVWSGDPFAPGTVVERVYVGGLEVYRAEGRGE